MIKFLNKNLLIVFLGASFLIFSTIFFQVVYAGTLSCSITTAGACTGTVIWRMSGSANAHAELPSQATAAYDNNVVCCSGVTGLGTSCSGTFATSTKLSGITNAHIEQNNQVNYENSACISVPSGGSVSIAYQSTNCSGYDTTLASMQATTNSHVGDTTAYTTKICGTAAGPAASLTLTVDTDSFPNFTPGTMVFATSTISVNTDNSTGWYVELYGQDQGLTDTVLDLSTDSSVGIPDQAEWIPGASTSTAGVNAVVRASLDSSGQVLAFRVMSASGSAPFLAPTWWGANDDDGTALWAGIPSSTAANLKIGNSSVSSGGGAVLNTVQYYLDTPITQQTGSYDGNLIFTATMNP